MDVEMIKYEDAKGIVVHEGEWVNTKGINEWDPSGDNPLDIKTYKVEELSCHFNIEGVCIHIGDKDLPKVEGIHVSEKRKVYSNPVEGRFVRD